MGRTRLSLLALLAVVIVSARVRLGTAKEVGPPGGWDSDKGAPAWITALPGNPAAIEVAIASQSNLLHLAEPRSDEWIGRQVRLEAIWRLRPLLGEAADAIPDAAFPTPTRVKKAFHLTPPSRGKELVVGSQTYTVWLLYESPLAPVLAAIPEARREDAKKALASAEPADAPKWEETATPPAWALTPTAPSDTLPVVVSFPADREDVAKAQAASLAGGHVAWEVSSPLRALLGAEGAWKVGNSAMTWRHLVSRAVVGSGHGDDRFTAYARYDVPVARVLAAAPEEQRAAVAKAIAERRSAAAPK